MCTTFPRSVGAERETNRKEKRRTEKRPIQKKCQQRRLRPSCVLSWRRTCSFVLLSSALSSSLSRGIAIRSWLLFTLSLSRERERETMPLGNARSSCVQTWLKAESREKCQLRPRVPIAFIRSSNGYVPVLSGYWVSTQLSARVQFRVWNPLPVGNGWFQVLSEYIFSTRLSSRLQFWVWNTSPVGSGYFQYPSIDLSDPVLEILIPTNTLLAR